MGQIYDVCTACGEPYSDHSSRIRFCGEDHGGCGKAYCSASCAELQNWDKAPFPTWEDERKLSRAERDELYCSCVHCRGELANDANLLEYALDRIGVTRAALTADYLAASKGLRLKKLETERAAQIDRQGGQ